jgi:serine acetyltransferase
MKTKTKFKIGDKVKILPSATTIGVRESEVGKVVNIRSIYNESDGIMITDSRGVEYGCWCVNDYDITPAIKVGQQLLFDFMMP